MKHLLLIVSLLILVVSSARADDLYKVKLHSRHDAAMLRGVNTRVVMAIADGYIVLCQSDQSEAFRQLNLDLTLLASDIVWEQLHVNSSRHFACESDVKVIHQEGQLRLLLADQKLSSDTKQRNEIFDLPERHIEITYHDPSQESVPVLTSPASEDLLTLINSIEQDSLLSYVLQLEAFLGRLAGTDSNYAARDWIAAKFSEFGYDSVIIDPFIGQQLWTYDPCQCYNVIAVKPGNLTPEHQIVIGAHFDAVPYCPGADDNASGTATVLECARILQGVDNEKTLVFIAFDSEESWMDGSYHYVDGAVEREDNIVLMINVDMIGYDENTDQAIVYHGPEAYYANLWATYASIFVGLTSELLGSSASDHLPFQQAGYDVLWPHEKVFSPMYHLSRDSSSYMDFDYMTKVAKATMATMASVDFCPPPIDITSIRQTGDGQSLTVCWKPLDPAAVSYFRLYYFPTANQANLQTVDVPGTDSSVTVTGLTEGAEYGFNLKAYDEFNQKSPVSHNVYGTPTAIPAAPDRVVALPLRNGVEIIWSDSVTESDFDLYTVIRDGEAILETTDTSYTDNDPALGYEPHYYHVRANDTDGIQSDTVGVSPACSKVAAMSADRILAVNRSVVHTVDLVDEVETGVFLRDALADYDFDYFSDTVATECGDSCHPVALIDMVDYGMVVIGAESGRYDDIAADPEDGGMLDTLAYYLSLGGKAVIFGRWGDIRGIDSIHYLSDIHTYNDAYYDYFHIPLRVKTITDFPILSPIVTCDLIGAHPATDSYPELAWDSLATLAHANGSWIVTDVCGVPCASFVEPANGAVDVIYTYDSRYDDPLFEGKPVAWRYLGSDYRYVWFDIPLSSFERTTAKAALCRAIEELLGNTTIVNEETNNQLPGAFHLSQNYPNPFNPTTEISYSLPRRAHVNLSIYNILGQKVATVVNREQPGGIHTARWNGTDNSGDPVSSGIYLYQMKAGGVTVSRKMLLIK